MLQVDNAQIARAFDELADLLELDGENPFKLRAYRNFAETARELDQSLADIAMRGELTDMDGVGKAIAAKVEQMLATGTFEALDRARSSVPLTLLDLLRLPGFGAKTVRTIWQGAQVTTLAELVRACDDGRLAALPGIGIKKQTKARAAALELIEGAGSTLLFSALEASAELEAHLKSAGVTEVVLTGAARRGMALVNEVLVLAREADPARILESLAGADPDIDMLPPEGSDIAVLVQGTRVHVRAVPNDAWIATLVSTTGSDAHVRFLEERAGGADGFRSVCGRAHTERDVYAALGLSYVPPELRDQTRADVPASLVERLHGVFHVHTEWSDGKATIAGMARAARDAGFAFVGISDHSRAASYANGLDAARLREQIAAMERARAEVPEVTILHGVEVDIMPDGTLDLDDDILAELDFVIASVHARLDMSPEAMTSRIVRAVRHPLVTMLGHPTGRLLRARRGYTFDIAAVARAAADNDTYLEINGNAHRLDLSDTLARQAADVGARFAVNPDAHTPAAFADTSLGLTVARRAGLSKDRILNAAPRDDLVRILAARKEAARARLTSV